MFQFHILGEEKTRPCWRCQRALPVSSFVVEQCIRCDKELEALK